MSGVNVYLAGSSGRTVEPSIGKILFGSLVVDCSPPQRRRASSGVIMDMSREVGIRSAMLSGVFSAGRPVDVMRLISGNESGLDVTMNKVPSAM